jgi:hypothetical protein
MKKLIVLLFFASLTFAVSAQGLFKPVTLFPTQVENNRKLSVGEVPLTQKWVWRFDASIAIVELNYNKDSKQFVSNTFSAIGPAIGYQHFVPTSSTDPAPFNNYGFSAAVLLGKNIYDPNLASIKVAVVANIMQYFKFGLTYTPNPSQYISPFGGFFGGGITF